MPRRAPDYYQASRAPRHSLTLALPLLALYEVMAFTLSGDAVAGLRNGADVLLKSLFVTLGGRTGLTVFALLLLGVGGFLAGRDARRHGGVQGRVLAGMAGEAVLYALLLGVTAATLTSWLLPGGIPILAVQAAGFAALDLPTQLTISLGAGFYEELLFRVLLVGALAWGGARVFGWQPRGAGIFAAVTGALIFSAFHYLGPYGDPWQLESFTFRAVAGLMFSAMYLLRGFGITAWAHALYDVFLSLG